MLGEHHYLPQEFPQYADRIHQLKTGNNSHFKKLYADYVEIDNNIYRIEQGIENTDDQYLESLKKKRLCLKDELMAIISQPKT